MNYGATLNLTDAAKRIFDGLEVPSSKATSLANLKSTMQGINKACISARKELEDERAELLKTYSQKVAGEKMNKLNSEFNEKVANIKDALSQKLNTILEAKKTAIANFVTMPAGDEQMRLIETVKMRGKSISDEEWEMLTEKLASSYQALSVLAEIAEKNNRTILLPFEPAKALAMVERAREFFMEAITYIDQDFPDNYIAREILCYDLNIHGRTPEMIKYLDSTIATATPVTTIDQLREARDHALHVGNLALFNTIHSFIWDNLDELKNKVIPSAEVRDAAKQLIKEGMEAKEKGPEFH